MIWSADDPLTLSLDLILIALHWERPSLSINMSNIAWTWIWTLGLYIWDKVSFYGFLKLIIFTDATSMDSQSWSSLQMQLMTDWNRNFNCFCQNKAHFKIANTIIWKLLNPYGTQYHCMDLCWASLQMQLIEKWTQKNLLM